MGEGAPGARALALGVRAERQPEIARNLGVPEAPAEEWAESEQSRTEQEQRGWLGRRGPRVLDRHRGSKRHFRAIDKSGAGACIWKCEDNLGGHGELAHVLVGLASVGARLDSPNEVARRSVTKGRSSTAKKINGRGRPRVSFVAGGNTGSEATQAQNANVEARSIHHLDVHRDGVAFGDGEIRGFQRQGDAVEGCAGGSRAWKEEQARRRKNKENSCQTQQAAR